MTSKAFVRATGPTFLYAIPISTINTLVKSIVLTDSFTLKELNRTVEVRKTRFAQKVQPLPHYRVLNLRSIHTQSSHGG